MKADIVIVEGDSGIFTAIEMLRNKSTKNNNGGERLA